MVKNPNIYDIKLTSVVGLDLETTGLFPWLGAKIDLIAIANQYGDKYVLEARRYSKEDLILLFTNLSTCKCVGHNIKFDCNFILFQYGVQLTNIFCTQIAAQIIDNGRQKFLHFDLVSVIERFLGKAYAIDKAEKKMLQKSFLGKIIPDVLRDKQILYASEDTAHLIKLYEVQKQRIDDKGLNNVLRLELKLLPVLSKMEVTGTKVDTTLWKSLIEEWNNELTKLEDALDIEASRLTDGKQTRFKFNRNRRTSTQTDIFGDVTNTKIYSESCPNYASSDQLLSLWRDFGEFPPVDNEGNSTVGEGAITTYVTENPNTRLNTFLNLLLEYRELAKLSSTYGEMMMKLLDKEQCIHTSYTQTRTETGRLSSKEPNLQNIPSKGRGKRLRECFIPRKGRKMITCDMAGAEVAIAADYSKEPLLLDALKNGADMHSKLATVSFNIIFKHELNEVQISKSKDELIVGNCSYILNDLRDNHKSVVFAKFYKGGAKRVYGVLSKYINNHHIPEDRMVIANEISKALDEAMPTLSQYLTHQIEQAQSNGYLISDKIGRIRYFNKETVYGDAANYAIQGTNASALKMALINIDKWICENPEYEAQLLMNIHDEVVAECNEHYAEIVAEKIKEIMADSLSYFLTEIKGGASVSIDNHWKK